jgi:hyperosmotically inducible periplasmic protein
MKKTVSITLLLAGLALPALAIDQNHARQNQQDDKVKVLVTEQLQKQEKFRSITAQVDDGIVTITGEVPLYIDKQNAEKRVRKVKNVDGVRNHLQIGGPVVADSEVQENLANKLRYDRIGYGIVFNNLAVGVNNGAVTITGNVRDYPDRDSAIAIVSTTAGVKDVVDEINVAPASFFDDGLRIRLARAIYGDSTLQKYALDPQAPIRIVVENGNVELAGVVLTDLDRQIAYSKANQVPGVFSVTNNLAVANHISE